MQIAFLLVISSFYYFFKSREDSIDSKYTKNQTDSKNWHKENFFQVLFFAIGISFGLYGFNIDAFFGVAAVGFLSVVLFNPLMAGNLGAKSFFHIGQGTIEKNFTGREKLYYIINCCLFIVSIVFLF